MFPFKTNVPAPSLAHRISRSALWGGVAALGTLAPQAGAQTTLAMVRTDATAPASAERTAPEVAARPLGSLSGVITDTSAAAVPEATVVLEALDPQERRTVQAGEDGVFLVSGMPAGTYKVTVTRAGFDDWHGAATVNAAEQVTLPVIALSMSAVSSSVEVRASAHEVAEAQLGLEEKQRVLGVFPNFYASYAPNAEPLSSGEKFRLAWRFAADPVAFTMAGVVAGSEQRADTFHAYGRGSLGYAKRYGAAYTDGLTSTMIGQALLPAIFHQDPRYFVKGTGSTASRVAYAMASMVICKGDNRRWQPNYSNVLGNFASASISNVYYPSANRGGGLILENALTATALGAVGGLFQEFLLHRMTPNIPDYAETR